MVTSTRSASRARTDTPPQAQLHPAPRRAPPWPRRRPAGRGRRRRPGPRRRCPAGRCRAACARTPPPPRPRRSPAAGHQVQPFGELVPLGPQHVPASATASSCRVSSSTSVRSRRVSTTPDPGRRARPAGRSTAAPGRRGRSAGARVGLGGQRAQRERPVRGRVTGLHGPAQQPGCLLFGQHHPAVGPTATTPPSPMPCSTASCPAAAHRAPRAPRRRGQPAQPSGQQHRPGYPAEECQRRGAAGQQGRVPGQPVDLGHRATPTLTSPTTRSTRGRAPAPWPGGGAEGAGVLLHHLAPGQRDRGVAADLLAEPPGTGWAIRSPRSRRDDHEQRPGAQPGVLRGHLHRAVAQQRGAVAGAASLASVAPARTTSSSATLRAMARASRPASCSTCLCSTHAEPPKATTSTTATISTSTASVWVVNDQRRGCTGAGYAGAAQNAQNCFIAENGSLRAQALWRTPPLLASAAPRPVGPVTSKGSTDARTARIRHGRRVHGADPDQEALARGGPGPRAGHLRDHRGRRDGPRRRREEEQISGFATTAALLFFAIIFFG